MKFIKQQWPAILFGSVCVLAFVTLSQCNAHAQFQPIPNGSGLQVRNALNAKLSGSDSTGISPVVTPITMSQLPSSVTNGQVYYVRDAAFGTPCVSGGSGAFALGTNGVWSCGPVAGGPGTPVGAICSHQTSLVGSATILAGATNNAGCFTTPLSATDVDNCTITFSTPSAMSRLCGFRVSNFDNSASIAGVADTATATTARVDFASAGGTSTSKPLNVCYTCF